MNGRCCVTGIACYPSVDALTSARTLQAGEINCVMGIATILVGVGHLAR